MNPPADLSPGVVLAHLGNAVGGMMAVRVAGQLTLTRRPDGLLEFPAGWTKALVKTTAKETGMRVHHIEPDPDGRATLTHLEFWIVGAFKLTATVTNAYLAPRVWKAMRSERHDPSQAE